MASPSSSKTTQPREPTRDYRESSSPAPRHNQPEPLLALQNAVGNQAVNHLLRVGRAALQTKLTVSQPGDKYEQEADRVAHQVMRMPESRINHQLETHAKEPRVGQFLGLTTDDKTDIESTINSTRGNGSPLTKESCRFFERRFNHNFSNVRIHADTEAEKLNLKLGAHAFTIGQNIYFRQGEYNPLSLRGRELIAHELAHVLQQSQSSFPSALPTIQRRERGGSQPTEREAGLLRTSEIESRLRGAFVDAALNTVDFIIRALRGEPINFLVDIPSLQASPHWERYHRVLQQLLLRLGEFIEALQNGMRYGILAENIDLILLYGREIEPEQTHLLYPFADFLSSVHNIDILRRPHRLRDRSLTEEGLIYRIIAFHPYARLQEPVSQPPPPATTQQPAPVPQTQQQRIRLAPRLLSTQSTEYWIEVPEPHIHPDRISGILTPLQASFAPIDLPAAPPRFELLIVGGIYCYRLGNRLVWLPDLPRRFPSLQQP
jgi:hypothetical protein